MKVKNTIPILAGSLLLLLGASTGCASKKDVRAAVAPLDQRLGQVETTNASQAEHLSKLDEKLDQDVARLEEIAKSAQQDANSAGSRADSAKSAADQAMARANDAHSLGEKANSTAEAALNRLSNLDNYRLFDEETVQFKINSSKLEKSAQEKLDTLVANLSQGASYIIEVQGFTDPTGGQAINDRLSDRRSQTVVKYMVAKHQVPMHRIYAAGLGSELPKAENKTRDGRKENRRVEVRVFVQDLEAGRDHQATVSSVR